ncbi:MAG TPA: hypothetical protein VKV73_08725 [Chloroflexota bacterium]|nr:hypothetical protein [Chloroflexota bacterium]
MTQDEFEQAVAADPALAGPMTRAAAQVPADRLTGVEDAAIVALMYPIARYVVVQIGLPWLYEAGRYTELFRLRFHDWVDGEYRRSGRDPEAARLAGEALRHELEKVTDSGQRSAWERFKDALAK